MIIAIVHRKFILKKIRFHPVPNTTNIYRHINCNENKFQGSVSDMEDLIQFIGHFSAISNAIVQKDKHYFIDHQDIYIYIPYIEWKDTKGQNKNQLPSP